MKVKFSGTMLKASELKPGEMFVNAHALEELNDTKGVGISIFVRTGEPYPENASDPEVAKVEFNLEEDGEQL